MKNYFQGCTTLDEAKAQYKKWVFELHPDVSQRDSEEEFKAMQNQFENFKPETEKYKTEFENHKAADFMDIINDLLNIKHDIEIEICGSFIWISGDTRSAKDQIKAVRNEAFKPAQWHKKKYVWFFAPVDYRKFSTKEFDMDEIRGKYGSDKYKPHQAAKISGAAEMKISYSSKKVEFGAVTGAYDVQKYLRQVWGKGTIEHRESFKLVCLNQAAEILGVFNVADGGVAGVSVDLKVLFQAALLSNSTSIIVAHNHPSGNLTPSEQDKNITKRIKEAALLLDLRLNDHIILTANSYFSFSEEGIL
jgi:DNA repair protein RadC